MLRVTGVESYWQCDDSCTTLYLRCALTGRGYRVHDTKYSLVTEGDEEKKNVIPERFLEYDADSGTKTVDIDALVSAYNYETGELWPGFEGTMLSVESPRSVP